MNNSSTTSFIVINSKYRTSDSRSTSDFNYNIGQTLEAGAVTIKNISIPVTQYNIGTHNNKLKIFSGGLATSLIVPVGQYTIASLSTAIETLIQGAIGGVVDITVDDTTKKLILTSTVALQIGTDPITSSISKYLGLNYEADEYYPPFPPSNTINFVNVPELQGSNNYYLASNVLSQGFASILTNGQLVPIIMPVPISVEWGKVQQYESNDTELNTKRFARLQNLQNIDIKVYDDDLNVVDLNGADIEVVIKIKTGDNQQPEYLNK